YKAHYLPVIPINPKADEIEGLLVVNSLSEIPQVDSTVSVSVITPPVVTSKVVSEAIRLGIKNLWLQPGSESPEAVALAIASGVNVISGGPCILVSGEVSLRDSKL
ncbi:hypothetical protein HK096_010498, partial [Nowakowskiella sp. JEL0078]